MPTGLTIRERRGLRGFGPRRVVLTSASDNETVRVGPCRRCMTSSGATIPAYIGRRSSQSARGPRASAVIDAQPCSIFSRCARERGRRDATGGAEIAHGHRERPADRRHGIQRSASLPTERCRRSPGLDGGYEDVPSAPRTWGLTIGNEPPARSLSAPPRLIYVGRLTRLHLVDSNLSNARRGHLR